MMPGMIMLWSGSIATIPSGWHLCDGTVGTPDLRNRFIACAQEDVAGVPKAILTSYLVNYWNPLSHSHPFTGDGHAHDLADGNAIKDDTPIGDLAHATDVSPASGDTGGGWSVPKSWVLAYIMKL